MSITIQTRTEILNDLRAFLRARQPNIILAVDTDEGAILESLAEAIYGLQVLLRAIEADVYPTTAVGTALDEHAKTRLATSPRKGATTSRGVNALRITGTDSSVIQAGEPLTHSDGTQFETEDEATISGGYVDVTIVSVTTGTTANKGSGETLQFDSAPAGVNSTATLVGDVDGAVDEEDDEALRVRLLQAYQSPPAGGRGSDYWAWAMAVTGVDATYIYEPHSGDLNGLRGLGTVDAYITAAGTGANRVASAALIALVQDALDDNRPAGTDALASTPGTTTQAVDVQVEPETGFAFDWTGTCTVSSYTPGTLTITLTGDIPDSLMAAVDDYGSCRIYNVGEVMTVVSYNDPTDEITLSAAPTTTPTGTIYPGGPLSQTLLDVVTAIFDALGPGRGTAASPSQEWEDELKVADLFAQVRGTTGVDDVDVVTPSANVTPSETVLLIPGMITIRPL